MMKKNHYILKVFFSQLRKKLQGLIRHIRKNVPQHTKYFFSYLFDVEIQNVQLKLGIVYSKPKNIHMQVR